MLDLNALAEAQTIGQVLTLLPTEAPDLLTHVVLNSKHALGGQVLAVDFTPTQRPGYRHVQTLGGPVEVAYGDIIAHCFLPGNRSYGEAQNWSPNGIIGAGFYPTHAEALAALPTLAQDAEKQVAQRQKQVNASWHRTVGSRY